MWGAIIQAIDHAAGRLKDGAGAGIKVASSQSGGAASTANPAGDAGSGLGESIRQAATAKEDNTAEDSEMEQTDGAGVGKAESGEGSGVLGDSGASLGGDIGIEGGAGGEDAASGAADMLSDERTKKARLIAQSVVRNWRK